MKQTGDLADKLSEQGYRLTPQRAMILATIADSTRHISAEEIHAQVAAKYPQVNISTVYRTLELLKRLGLIYEINLGEGRIRYHPEGKGHHHHLVCQKCGAVIDIDESALASLKENLFKQYAFSAQLRHVAFFGLCQNCRSKGHN